MTNNLFYNFNDYGEYNVEYSLYGTPSFDGCVTLKRVSLPVGTTAIYGNMFSDCVQLEEVDIPNGVKRIESAFQNTKISELVLPPTISYVDCQGLNNLPSLERIVCKAKRPPEFNNSYEMNNVELCVPYDMIDLYKEEFEGTFASITPIIYGIEEVGEVTVLTEVVDKYTSYVKVKFDMVATIEEGHEPTEIHDAVKDVYIGVNNTGNTRIIESVEIYGFEKEVYIEQSAEILNRNKLILYTSEDGEIVEPDDVYSFDDAVIVDNVYEDNQGVIIFDRELTSIGEWAFEDCSSLTNIVIPDSVTSIGEGAFSSCSSLEGIVIGNGVTSIGDEAFYDCSKLSSITCYAMTAPTIQSGTFYGVDYDGLLYKPYGTNYDAWMSTSDYYLGLYEWGKSDIAITVNSLTNQHPAYTVYANATNAKIVFDANITVNGKTMDVTDSVTITIEMNTTGFDRTLTKNFTYNGYEARVTFVQKGVEGVLSNQIWYTSTDGAEVTPSSTSAFGGATIVSNEYDDGKGIIEFNRDLTSIGNWAFNYCYSLASIKIPDSVTSIGGNAFEGCSSLEDIVIPDSVTSIGSYAFQYCSSLEDIVIGNGVTSIGYEAFYACSSLDSIVVSEGNQKYDSRDNCNAIIETATNTLIFGCKNTVIPDSVTSIGSSAFQSCSSLTGIVIPDSVTSIGEYAFQDCSSLTNVKLGNGLKYIPYSCFYECPLSNITIPEGVLWIESQAFYNCSGLSYVELPSTLMEIDGGAFDDCYSLCTIVSHAEEAPYFNYDNYSRVFDSIIQYGKLFVPDNSDYSPWMTNRELGYYKWSVEPISEIQPSDEIWYTTHDGEIFEFAEIPEMTYGGPEIISNTYENGKGVMKFAEPIEWIGFSPIYNDEDEIDHYEYSFHAEEFDGGPATNLKTVSLPEGVQYAGTFIDDDFTVGAFYGNMSIEEITIPSTFQYAGDYTFYDMPNLIKIVNKSPYISYSNNPIGGSIPENGTIYVQYNPYDGIDLINGITYYEYGWTPKWVNEDCTVDIYDYFENGGGGGGGDNPQ